MTNTPTTAQSVFYGLTLRCPKCGKGKLFKSYLKQNDFCPECGESYRQYRADDGPAWLTILLTGHIVVPLLVYLVKNDVMPYWAEIILMFSLTTALVLGLLPSAKGAFISVLWLTSPTKHSAKPASEII
jgi:uncharacterized protein (DUF983 family)